MNRIRLIAYKPATELTHFQNPFPMKNLTLRFLYLALATSLIATGCKKKEAETDTTTTTTDTTSTAQTTTKQGTVVEKIFGKGETATTNKFRFQPEGDNTTMLRLTKASPGDGAAQAESMEIDLSTMANKKVSVTGSEFGTEWVYNANVTASAQ